LIKNAEYLQPLARLISGHFSHRVRKTLPRWPVTVGIQVPSVDDVAHAASIEELGRLVKTLGYEVVGTMSQKRDGIGGGTVLGKGRLEELAAITECGAAEAGGQNEAGAGRAQGRRIK
jgi:hypothetical protein